MNTHVNNFPKLHNAAWPGVVGKGPGAEPPIDLDTMLDLTAAAEVDGVKFDGFDLFLFLPHINIDASHDELRELADKASSRGLVIGTVVAPVWPPTGGGSAMGDAAEQQKFLTQVLKGCRIAKELRELGVRRTAPCASIPPAACPTGRPIPWRVPNALRTRSARLAISPRTTASDWRPKAKSAGAGCTA